MNKINYALAEGFCSRHNYKLLAVYGKGFAVQGSHGKYFVSFEEAMR